MSLPDIQDFATRRQLLANQIARQRVQFTQAYENLEKPIRFAEYGMKGYSVFRNYQWVLTAVPPAIGLLSFLAGTFFGGKKKKKTAAPTADPVKSAKIVPGPYTASQAQEILRQPEGLKKSALMWAGRAWELFQLYRRIKPYLL